jgi:chromosome partitioning protein
MRLAVCSSKGGVGKTAIAANLATVLAERGRTLAVDADPQESLGRAFGVVAGADDSLAAVLDPERDLPVRAAIRSDVLPGLDVLPAHTSLEQVGTALAQQGGLIGSLRRALRPAMPSYDYVVIDTHGDTGNMTLAAIAASTALVTVFTSDPGSALGAVRMSAFLNTHRRFENTESELLGAVCANWDSTGAAARDVAAALGGTDLDIFDNRIPFSRRVPSSVLAKRPVVASHPNSPVAEAYRAVTEETLTRYRKALSLGSGA